MSEERLKILRMLEEGKLSAEDAAKLLEAVEDGTAGSASSDGPNRRGRVLRVQVREGGKTKVNVNVPLSLARTMLNLIPKETLQRLGVTEFVDMDELGRMLEEGLEGKLVDVEDEDTKVEVRVE